MRLGLAGRDQSSETFSSVTSLFLYSGPTTDFYTALEGNLLWFVRQLRTFGDCIARPPTVLYPTSSLVTSSKRAASAVAPAVGSVWLAARASTILDVPQLRRPVRTFVTSIELGAVYS
jgi:hypothetical protein